MIKKLIKIALLFMPLTCLSFNSNETFVSFNKQDSGESIYVHTSGDIFFAGDAILYKLYRINSNSQNIHWKSRVAYLTITDVNGAFVSKNQLMIQNGIHNGYITIPDTLSSGVYKINCWTNIMLINNQPTFTKQIFVLNRFDQNPLKEILPYLDFEESSMQKSDSLVETPSTIPTNKIFPKINNEQVNISLSADKGSYKPRKKVTLTIDNSDLPEDIFTASISVVRAEAIVTNNKNILHQHSNLQNERHLSSPKFDNTIPENFGLVVSGKVISKSTGNAEPNVTVLLTTPDSVLTLKYSETTTDGSFHFLIDEYYRGRSLYLSIFNPQLEKNDFEIQLNNKYFSEVFTPEKMLVNSELNKYVETLKIVKRTNKAYKLELINENSNEQNNNKCPYILYHHPTSRIRTADYVPLTNFHEIASEIIPVLKIQEQKGKQVAKMVSNRTRNILSGDPQFFLNGIYVSNMNDLLSVPFRDIDFIDIINLPWAYGKLEFNGIVSVFTKQKGYVKFENNNYTIFQGIPQENEYIVNFPCYDEKTANHTIPDFRELLYWNPNITVQKEISFYTSDLTGNYIAIFEGVTSSGLHFSTSTRISVTE